MGVIMCAVTCAEQPEVMDETHYIVYIYRGGVNYMLPKQLNA